MFRSTARRAAPIQANAALARAAFGPRHARRRHDRGGPRTVAGVVGVAPRTRIASGARGPTRTRCFHAEASVCAFRVDGRTRPRGACGSPTTATTNDPWVDGVPRRRGTRPCTPRAVTAPAAAFRGPGAGGVPVRRGPWQRGDRTWPTRPRTPAQPHRRRGRPGTAPPGHVRGGRKPAGRNSPTSSRCPRSARPADHAAYAKHRGLGVVDVTRARRGPRDRRRTGRSCRRATRRAAGPRRRARRWPPRRSPGVARADSRPLHPDWGPRRDRRPPCTRTAGPALPVRRRRARVRAATSTPSTATASWTRAAAAVRALRAGRATPVAGPGCPRHGSRPVGPPAIDHTLAAASARAHDDVAGPRDPAPEGPGTRGTRHPPRGPTPRVRARGPGSRPLDAGTRTRRRFRRHGGATLSARTRRWFRRHGPASRRRTHTPDGRRPRRRPSNQPAARRRRGHAAGTAGARTARHGCRAGCLPAGVLRAVQAHGAGGCRARGGGCFGHDDDDRHRPPQPPAPIARVSARFVVCGGGLGLARRRPTLRYSLGRVRAVRRRQRGRQRSSRRWSRNRGARPLHVSARARARFAADPTCARRWTVLVLLRVHHGRANGFVPGPRSPPHAGPFVASNSRCTCRRSGPGPGRRPAFAFLPALRIFAEPTTPARALRREAVRGRGRDSRACGRGGPGRRPARFGVNGPTSIYWSGPGQTYG